MLEVHHTHQAKIRNHGQVADSLDRHGWSASKLWNVANYHSRDAWEETKEIPDHEGLKNELKTHPKCSIENAVRERNHSVLTSFFRSLSANERMISRNCRY